MLAEGGWRRGRVEEGGAGRGGQGTSLPGGERCATVGRMSFSPPEPVVEPAASPQARALARSLAERRAASAERLASFVAATRDLAAETGSSSFTVQQVVARSGQSLKSFYRLFAGKDDLLLALLEEDVALGGVILDELVQLHDDPGDRIRAWVDGVFELLAAGEQGYVGVLVREHDRLAESHPDQLAAALAPLLAPLVAALADAMAAGRVRSGDPDRDAGTVLDVVLAQIHRLVPPLAPIDDAAERAARVAETARYAREFCWAGLVAPAPDDGPPGGDGPPATGR